MIKGDFMKRKIGIWVVDRLPKIIIYLAAIRLAAQMEGSETSLLESIKRYGEDNAEDIL